MLPPTAQVASRAPSEAAPRKGGGGGLSRSETLARGARAADRQGREKVFYNSAKAPRSCLGSLRSRLACPGQGRGGGAREGSEGGAVGMRRDFGAAAGPTQNATLDAGDSSVHYKMRLAMLAFAFHKSKMSTRE